ncbi:MAG: hypothetical protein IT440_04820 [Phycisphaeraceae bacterium]|nr:hypothetical protein [Phycisphaeraceae bacterium]
MSHSEHSPAAPEHAASEPAEVNISSLKFVIGCIIAAAIIGVVGSMVQIPAWFMAAEVFLTIIALFVFGSFKYRIHKNAMTYGMAIVIVATFFRVWWPMEHAAEVRNQIADKGWTAWLPLIRENLLSFHGLDHLIHLDTMLFILGLTFFVAVVAQTRLLESVTFKLLRMNKGKVLPTVLAVTAVVSFASGILDGVSMIGLTIRTLVIILALAAAPTAAVRRAVMICTVVTTVCGMWLAYGEPPNLIMKAGVIDKATGKPILNDLFFLSYCLPAAIVSYLCVAWVIRCSLKGMHVNLEKMDVVDSHVAAVRFLQAQRHGEVFSAMEFVELKKAEMGSHAQGVEHRVTHGESLGLALVRENVPENLRKKLLGEFVSEDLAVKLDRHYVLESKNQSPGDDEGEVAVKRAFAELEGPRMKACKVAAFALVPFVGLLVYHAMHHEVPLFWSSTAGFFVALFGVANLKKMRSLALKDAFHEYAEYYFLFPLFLSISLLSEVGFFEQLKSLLESGIDSMGITVVAWIQFMGATALSAILDNNVVADFASKAITDLPNASHIKLFSMAQIAGYAAGGCLTHIGSAQSVVAFAFILRAVDSKYTPLQWVKEMASIGALLVVALTALIIITGMIH